MLRVSSGPGGQCLLSPLQHPGQHGVCLEVLPSSKTSHLPLASHRRPFGPCPAFRHPQLLLSQSLLCLFSCPAQMPPSAYPQGALGEVSALGKAVSASHPWWGIGRCLCRLLGTGHLSHGQSAGQLCLGGSEWGWLTPGPSLSAELPGVYALPAGDAAGQPRGCLMPQPCLPFAECNQTGAGQPGLPGHHPVRTPPRAHTPQPSRGATDANQVPSFLALVQPSPQGTGAGVLVQFWLSGLDTVPRMAPWHLNCPKYQ